MEINLTPDFIIEHVSIYLGTCKRAILSDSRYGTISDARQICMYFAYKSFESNYSTLSHYFNRSQWGVRYGVETVIALMSVDKEFEKKVNMVERHLIAQRITELSMFDIQHEIVSKTENYFV